MHMSFATLYQWLFLLHIVGAMVWVGGSVLLAVLGSRAVRSAVDALAAVGRLADDLDPRVLLEREAHQGAKRADVVHEEHAHRALPRAPVGRAHRNEVRAADE